MRRTRTGWNNSPVTVTFRCEDPAPGSGVEAEATGGGTVNQETAGVVFTSAGCIDAAGHDAPPVRADVMVDWTPPVVAVSSITPPPTPGEPYRSDVTVTFSCTDTGAAPSGIAEAPPPITVAQDGHHVVTSGDCVDLAANRATPVSVPIDIDQTPPVTTIESGPDTATAAASATFTYSAVTAEADDLAGFECSLDDAPFEPCPSEGVTYAGLADGPHVISVTARDRAGNVDPTPATWTWVVDSIAPETRVLSVPIGSPS